MRIVTEGGYYEKIGTEFGRLTTIGNVFVMRDVLGYSRAWVVVECQCGQVRCLLLASLRTGNTKSCNCSQREIVKKLCESQRGKVHPGFSHGLTGTAIYAAWRSMISRCENPKSQRYARYGGRGISVCDEWKRDAGAFGSWAIASGYEPGLSIDRIDNDGNYEPANCQWITRAENSRKRGRDGRASKQKATFYYP